MFPETYSSAHPWKDASHHAPFSLDRPRPAMDALGVSCKRASARFLLLKMVVSSAEPTYIRPACRSLRSPRQSSHPLSDAFQCWHVAPPVPNESLGLRLIPAEYTALSKLCLGEPLLPPDADITCGACGEPADIFGDHFLCCRKAGLVQRHRAIISQLWHIVKAAGHRAEVEVSLDGRTRPADLLLPHWQGGGPCAIDAAIVHPLAPSIPVHRVKDGSEAVVGMERIKLAKYSECCRESKVQFVPFVLSTFGKLGGESDRFYQHLAACFRPADTDFDSDRDLGSLYMQQLQVVLKREVARMLLQGQAGYSSSDVTVEQPLLADLVDDYDCLIAAEPSVCAELPLHPQSDRLSVAAHMSE